MDESSEKLSNKSDTAKRQLDLAVQWSELYASDTSVNDGPELVFDNPIAYIRSGSVDKLSDDLRTRWNKLQFVCAFFVLTCTGETRDHDQTESLRAMKELVNSGIEDKIARDAMAGLMLISSELFSDSVAIRSGDSRYYERNLKRMADKLPTRPTVI